MSRHGAPEVATTRVMAETLAALFAFGGGAGLCMSFGIAPGIDRWLVMAHSVAGLLAAAVAARWARRWPRPAFHVAVASGTVLSTGAVLVAPDPVSSLALATIIVFVVIDAHLFFPARLALAHLVFALTATNVALVLTGGIAVSTILGLDLVLTGLGAVTRRLVIRASSASRDPLTGLSNRRGFDNALRELMDESARTVEPLSAALLDLDHFKAVNDTAGHEAGDRMLCRVADAWRGELPRGAVLARHGGDEFSLILPRTGGEAALALVRRICATHPEVRMSCGVAEHHGRETASQLMRRADRALYDAKESGRGRAELDRGAVADLQVTDLLDGVDAGRA